MADRGENTIRKITADGTVSTLAGHVWNPCSGGECPGVPCDVNVDGSGPAATFCFPTGVERIARETSTWRIPARGHSGDPDGGVVTTLAGLDIGFADGSGATAEFNNPISIAADAASNLYVADQTNYDIRKITSAGVVTTLAGAGPFITPTNVQGQVDGTGQNAVFSNLQGIVVDAAGNTYVTDVGFFDPNWNWVNIPAPSAPSRRPAS